MVLNREDFEMNDRILMLIQYVTLSVWVMCLPYLYAQSLPETMALALDYNPHLAAQREAMKAAQLQEKSIVRHTLPKLELDAGYRHITERAELDFPAAGPIPGRTVQLGVYDSYETGLTVNYALFTGFAQSNQRKLGRQQVQLTRQQLIRLEKQIAFQTIVAYCKVQQYDLEIAALNASRDRSQLQLKRLKTMVDQGMALALDTLTLALSRLSYDQKIIAADAQYQTARQELAHLTGRNIQVSKADIPPLEIDPAELDISINDDLKMLGLQMEGLQTHKALNEATYYPRIVSYAGLKYGKPGVDFIRNEWMSYAVWGVAVNWNLFSWGGDRLKAQSQEVTVRQHQFQYQAVQDQIQTTYDHAVREYRAMVEQLMVLKQALELAQTRMHIIDTQYRKGISTATDFNSANLELSEAEINQKRQFIRMQLKLNEIDWLSGQPINSWRVQ